MSDDDSKTRVGFTVDEEAYGQAQAKLDWGEMSQRLRKAVHEIAYGTETTERRRLKEKLERLRSEKREIETTLEQKRSERDEKQRKISRVEERLDTLMDQSGEYEGFLNSIEQDLHDGKRFDPQHGKIERAAGIGGMSPQDVINDLKERNPDVPEEAFTTAGVRTQPNWKNEVDVDVQLDRD